MVKHQPIYPLKVGYCIVTELSCLVPLLAHDPNPNVRCLDHVDVIASVSNRTRELISLALNKLNDLCLLVRR